MVVTVAPQGYTGTADYYCTGVDDQILINAAIQYVSSAYGGGTVRLLEGTFNKSGSYDIISNITLTGSGVGTVNYETGLGDSVSASGSNCSLINMKFVNPRRIGFDGVAGLMISGCTFYGTFSGSSGSTSLIDIAACSDAIVENNTIDGNSQSSDLGFGYISLYVSPNTICRGNILKNLATSTECQGIWVSNDHCIITGNQINSLISSVAASISYGIQVLGDYSEVSGNIIQGVKNTATAANAYGIKIDATAASTKITSNSCFNNGSDAGIANTNGNNFYDAGTDTQVYSNSWQSPVSGEPAQGELHWRPQSTSTISGFVVNAVTTTAQWSSFSLAGFYPVGSKTAKVNIGVHCTSSATGPFNHFVAFSNDTTTSPQLGTTHPAFGIRAYSSGGAGESGTIIVQGDIPMDSSLKSYFYAFSRGNATNCLLYVAASGYDS
jgi:hypothetical protein